MRNLQNFLDDVVSKRIQNKLFKSNQVIFKNSLKEIL